MNSIAIFSSIAIILLQVNDYFVGTNSKSVNTSLAGFSNAIATFYDDPSENGSGGACGFENDVAKWPFNGFITAGNDNLFKSGKGCGVCYQVKCTENEFCSGVPITVTLTDKCPGACNNEPLHFDISKKAFGFLAKAGQAANLIKFGRINVQYERVNCGYQTKHVTFKVDRGSNKFFLSFAIEFVSGDGDIGDVQLFPAGNRGSIPMQQAWGATYKAGIPDGTRGPYSVRIVTLQTRRQIFAKDVIPDNWAPGAYYESQVF